MRPARRFTQALTAAGLEPLYDDRDERAGGKFATMDLIGLPWRITVGPRGLKNGVVELTSRRTGESEELPPEAAVARLAEIYALICGRWCAVGYSEARRTPGGGRLSRDPQVPRHGRWQARLAPFAAVRMDDRLALSARPPGRGRRVSVMTWISLIGITLAVFALIATLAVRSGFRAEFVDTILGANAHVTVYNAGRSIRRRARSTARLTDYDAMAARLRAVPGVTRAAPLVKGQVMATAGGRNAGVEVFGISADDLRSHSRASATPETQARATSDALRRGHRHRLGRGARTGRAAGRPDPADLARWGARPPSAPARASRPMRWSMSSPPGAGTSTAPASTCPSPRRRAISTAKAWRTRSR